MNVKDIIEFAAALIGLLTFGTVLGTVILLGMAA
jgi:hypothetical protein